MAIAICSQHKKRTVPISKSSNDEFSNLTSNTCTPEFLDLAINGWEAFKKASAT